MQCSSRLAFLIATAVLLFGGNASAQLEGVWRAGDTSMNVQVSSWGSDCGPQPRSTKSAGGGSVSITMDDKHLVIHSRNRAISTKRCWSTNPAIKRVSSSYVNGVWRTICKTGVNDPREEKGEYTVQQRAEGTLLYKDVSHYNWKLNESSCVATITTVQTLNRVTNKGAAPPPKSAPAPKKKTAAALPEPEPEPEPKTQCIAGAPAKLNLRPRRAQLAPAERVCFRAKVVDSSGCQIDTAMVSFKLRHSKAVRGRMEGHCFAAAESAAEGEGDFKVVASSGKLSAEAQVQVQAVDLSALIANQMETGAVSGFADEPQAEEPQAPVRKVATRSVETKPETGTRELAVAMAGLVCALVLGFLLFRRMGTRTPAPAPARWDEDSEPSAPVSQAPGAQPAAPPAPATTAEQYICPTCRQGYAATTGACPKDGTTLIPYSEFSKLPRPAVTAGKRCPKCDKSYPADSGFCSEDGSKLV